MAGTITKNKDIVQERGTAATQVVPEILGEACDACGSTLAWVPARYEASKDGKSLFFCAHHARRHAEKLVSTGFSLSPEDVSFDAGSK